MVCEEDGQKPSVRGTLQTWVLSLWVLTSKDLILCEKVQKQEATCTVKRGNDQVVGPGASEALAGGSRLLVLC